VKRIVIAAALVLAGGLISAAAADTPVSSGPPTPARIKVAIVPGIAVNLDTSRVDAIAQDMADALQSELDVDVVGGLDVRRALPADLPADCVTIPSCVGDVAKRTTAQQLLFVVMVDSGANGSLQIDTTWVDAATGRTAQRPAIDVLSAQDAHARFVSAAHSLLPDAPGKQKATSVVVTQPHLEPRHFTGGSLGLGIGGGVAVVAGIGLGLATKSKYDSCDATPATCTQSTRDSIHTLGIAADISWIVGTAALVTGAVLYLRSGGETVVVTPTEGGAAVTAVGRF
jgi:hypothetical protein